jgi:hypothetical protein
MKEKQWLVSESELKKLIRNVGDDIGWVILKDFLKDKQPVSTLDRDRVEQELYDMIGGLNETEYGEQINECVHIASKNICSLAVQPDRDKVLTEIKGLMREYIDLDMLFMSFQLNPICFHGLYQIRIKRK